VSELAQIPIVVLCGGRGLCIGESGRRMSKAMIEVRGEAMIVHVLGRYLSAGFRRFILSSGRQSDELRELLAVRGEGLQPATVRGTHCEIAVFDSGPDSNTGERIRRVRPLIGDVPAFGVTYSDTLSAVDPATIFRAHTAHGKIATLLGTHVPTRFRILGLRRGEEIVRGFAAKPVITNDFINGGFYFFERAIWSDSYLGSRPNLILEAEVLEALAADAQLVAHRYEGPWQFLDSERDLQALAELSQSLP
jgi:glucose-1-phosphate cytidylyltransferase